MDTAVKSAKAFVVGTTGWSVADLDDPEILRHWEQGRYEIVEGVLATMPAAYYDGSKRLRRLTNLVEAYLKRQGRTEEFAFEVDLVISRERVATADAVLMTAEDERRQREANAAPGSKLEYGRLLVAPTLLIESVSLGHDRHDRILKRRWYADAKVPHYWLLDAYSRALECLVLQGDEYRTDQAGRENDELKPSLFPGLVIPLRDLWV